jgi:hypothetical protein
MVEKNMDYIKRWEQKKSRKQKPAIFILVFLDIPQVLVETTKDEVRQL